ncbi:MAG: glycosyltransferase [Pirellulaceae bacterium]
MHVLFVHKNFPAQFGHIAKRMVQDGHRCSFVTEHPSAMVDGVERIEYKVAGGARKENNFCSRSFENFVWNSEGVFEALRNRPDMKPDLVVGHSGFGSTSFLPELYDCPIVNYFEFFYHTKNSDIDFRPEENPPPQVFRRARARNAMLLWDLHTCAAGYSPTKWQKSLFPSEYQQKIEVIFDGIDTQKWKPLESRPVKRQIGDRIIPDDVQVVTYVSRGFESMRGFDRFMDVAKRIYQLRDDVVFVCVGSDRICYSGDESKIAARTYREHVFSQDTYDLDKFIFTGTLPADSLVKVLGMSDLHLYFTVPFVLSWSLLNAMACGCPIVASDTEPVQEVIQHGENGMLADFFDTDQFVSAAVEVLENQSLNVQLRKLARQTILDIYDVEVTYPKLVSYFENVTK